jgi:SAM-dependent methyltransferase
MLGAIPITKPPKRDIYQRAALFDEASFTHHAKMNLNLVQALLDRYTDPGDLVLDPMAGTGSAFVGLLTGRRVIAGDIEAQWARLLRENQIGLARQSLIALATPGLALRWDAAKLPLGTGQVDLCLTSPPYYDTFGDWDASSNILETRHNEHGLSYGAHPRQIANRHVYEDYLRAVRAVYAECWRVSRPGGKLVLVLKDVIRGGRRVPVVEDNQTLALATGFRLLERFDVPARGTRFRNVNRARLGQAAPSTEPVLVFERRPPREVKRCLALLELPLPHDGPGWVIAEKAAAHAAGRGYWIWVRSPGENEFRPTSGRNRFPRRPAPGAAQGGPIGGPENRYKPRRTYKARIRREMGFLMAAYLVSKAGLGTGDEIAFYGSQRYGKYLCQRLATLGLAVTQPLYGLNNGQRLRWLTQKRKGESNG